MFSCLHLCRMLWGNSFIHSTLVNEVRSHQWRSLIWFTVYYFISRCFLLIFTINILNKERGTSWACSYLLKAVVKFFVRWLFTKSQPCERVIIVVGEQVTERFRSVPARWREIIIRYQHDVCPAVLFCDKAEHLCDVVIWASHTHHRVIGLWVIQPVVATQVWEERSVPIGQDVSRHCTDFTPQSVCFGYISLRHLIGVCWFWLMLILV